ncbi:Stress responsive A/B Barrel Domain protein [Actinomadura rubteroloni]|uniref:Stress responsive A/B Barrel Domain protein n=1 Tax=Actinomadura rubteroloni TaxID=1926885 RepID=A0A2P4UHD4_9ACTN|nr:Dabb family protein [Actinomadura rubteroloni]POM24465.1 Stress responsive A/B Barrel Domain protein [Actinomadura rubteroloni]
MSGFRHVVVFRWNEGTTVEQQEDLARRLRALPDAIPEIAAYSVGLDAGVNAASYDFAVVADFADRDAYLVYRDHPVHRAILDEFVAPITKDRAAVQFAF